MSKKINLTVDRWLGEISQSLMQSIVSSKSKECIITGAMSVGKTTFIKETVAPTVEKLKDRWLVLVLPGVTQLYQLNEAGIPIVCDGSRFNDTWFTGTTPDSLPKIMDKAKELNKQIWLVVDEAHAIVTSSGFRKSFLNIKQYVPQCEKVIYMTATIEPLMGMDMGDIYEVTRKNAPCVKITQLRVDRLNIDTVYKIIADRYDDKGVVYTHWNNVDNNTALSAQLQNLCLVKEKQVLVEEYQENLLGILPKYKLVHDEMQAVSLHAKNKDHPVTQGLIKGNVPDQVAFMCMTSFVKEGLNISNQQNSKIIIVWDNNLTYAELIQTIGRYRNQEHINEIVVVISNTPVAGKVYKPFETDLEEELDAAIKLNDAINALYNIQSDNLQEVLKSSYSIYDPASDAYIISEELYRNKVYTSNSNRLKALPNLVNKAFENEVAINLEPHIEYYEPVENKELADLVKATKEEKLQIFQDAVAQICLYDDQTIEEILNYTLDQRRFENREAVENMDIYHQLVGKKFKSQQQDLVTFSRISEVEAFKIVATTEPEKIDGIITQARACAVNRDIDELGIKEASKLFKVLKEKRNTKPISKQIFIRQKLQDLELKRGRLPKKRLKLLAQQMIDEGYYSGKKINLEKALPMLEQDLDLIYTFRLDNKGFKLFSTIKI